MNTAEQLFTAVPKLHNCAQSVVCGCGRDDLKDAMSGCGGGRAEGGLCGALYAALQMVPPEHRDALRQEFAARLGSTFCRTLKGEFQVPCVESVRLAAELTEKYRS